MLSIGHKQIRVSYKLQGEKCNKGVGNGKGEWFLWLAGCKVVALAASGVHSGAIKSLLNHILYAGCEAKSWKNTLNVVMKAFLSFMRRKPACSFIPLPCFFAPELHIIINGVYHKLHATGLFSQASSWSRSIGVILHQDRIASFARSTHRALSEPTVSQTQNPLD